MKSYLILPMGGVGQRFLNKGYSIYKPFLQVDAKNTIFTSDKLLLEGHIANEQEFLGRAVIEVCAFI